MLENQLGERLGVGESWIANFYVANIPTMADFKLLAVWKLLWKFLNI